MTDDTGRDAIIETDWGDIWETLPEAPPLAARPKATQVTLRVSPSSISRLKTVAAMKSLPYHALARSWISDGLRSPDAPTQGLNHDELRSAQLNLKVEQALLDSLKGRASALQRAYHALAREYIDSALEREEATLGIYVSAHL